MSERVDHEANATATENSDARELDDGSRRLAQRRYANSGEPARRWISMASTMAEYAGSSVSSQRCSAMLA